MSPAQIRAAAADAVAKAAETIVSDGPYPSTSPPLTDEELTAFKRELWRIAEVQRGAAQRLRSKSREIEGEVSGEFYSMQRRRLDGLWVACQRRGIALSPHELRGLLLDTEWEDPEHQSWLDKALADEMAAIVETIWKDGRDA